MTQNGSFWQTKELNHYKDDFLVNKNSLLSSENKVSSELIQFLIGFFTLHSALQNNDKSHQKKSLSSIQYDTKMNLYFTSVMLEVPVGGQ